MILDFCEYINDSLRILVLLKNAQSKKSLKLNEHKIKQFDYYLKFPYTMIGTDAEKFGFEESINEYYSFFHWQPDLIKYRQVFNYLLAKNFIVKDENSNYEITQLGLDALQKIDNDYLNRLNEFCLECVIAKIYKFSEKKIDQEIKYKANIISLRGLVGKNDNN